MNSSREELIFGSKMLQLAEKYFSASFTGPEGKKCKSKLYEEYFAAGKPTFRKWAMTQLESLFLCVNNRPIWVEPTCSWPFKDGRPMVFIRQLRVANTNITNEHLAPDAVLYIFGARHHTEEGNVEILYEVVSQYDDNPCPVGHKHLNRLFKHLGDMSSSGVECMHDFALTTQFLERQRLPVKPMLNWLRSCGSRCDCEVILNVQPQWQNDADTDLSL